MESIDSFVNSEVINTQEAAMKASFRTLLDGTGAGNDFLGWLHLPSTTDEALMDRIHEEVSRLTARCRLFVVVGIGGSYLGARAVIEALHSELAVLEQSDRPLIVYAGHTLDESYYNRLLPLLDRYSYGVVVISKSGTTTEPAVAFRIIKNHLEWKYGKKEARERTIAITDARRGVLHTIAEREGYPAYVIPDNVGGRFSVFTPVGLLPIALTGCDIDALMAGARDAEYFCTNEPYESNDALRYAVCRNALYRSGYKVEALVNFTPSLRYISEWWKQLYGESEGKEGKGILPHSMSFTTDLHSMGQYMQEGERMLMETVLSVRSSDCRVVIPTDEEDLDGVNYLTGKSLTEINHCAERGTIEAHREGGVPVMRIEIPRVDAYTLGYLMYFFEFACGVSGYMLGVNPFNQPGVEAYKRNMFRLLGKK